MQHEETLTALEFAGLSTYETWMHYCTMGGHLDYLEFAAYLHGLYTLPARDADTVSRSVNERIDDVCGADGRGMCRAPYSGTPHGVRCLPEEADATGDVVFDDRQYPGTAGRAEAGPWIEGIEGIDSYDDRPDTVRVDDLAGPHTNATFGSLFLTGLDLTALTGRPGVPVPPGCTLELLGEVLDSTVLGRMLS